MYNRYVSILRLANLFATLKTWYLDNKHFNCGDVKHYVPFLTSVYLLFQNKALPYKS